MSRSLFLLILLALLPVRALPMLAGPTLDREARVTWTVDDPRFGGFSGLEIADDGVSFVAISDRGSWAKGRLERDAGGRLAGVRLDALGALHGVEGGVLQGDNVDAEGLAIDALGRVFVSFEGFHRVRRYDDLGGAAASLPSSPDFGRLQTNSGLETLAIDAHGVLHAVPERSGGLRRPFPVYRLEGGAWRRAYGIPRRGEFVVTGADFGPDGRLYVLERAFRWLGGFATRVRRFDVGPDGLAGEQTLLETAYGELDNMEGIDVGSTGDGGLRVTLISDDNFFPLQRTEFVEFRLAEDGSPGR